MNTSLIIFVTKLFYIILAGCIFTFIEHLVTTLNMVLSDSTAFQIVTLRKLLRFHKLQETISLSRKVEKIQLTEHIFYCSMGTLKVCY